MAELLYRRHQATATTALQIGSIFTSSSDAVIPVSPKNDANVTWGPDSLEESLEEDTVAEVPGVGHCSMRMVNFFTVTVRAGRPDT